MPSAVIVASTPGARWKRMANGADSLILLRPRGISRSSPRNSLPSLPSVRRRWWIEAEAFDIAVVAGLDAGSNHYPRRGRRGPRRRPCRASRRAGSRSNCLSASTRVLCAAVVRSASARSCGMADRSESRAAAIDHQPLAAVGHFERQGRGAAHRGHPRRRRRRGVDDDDRAQRRQPLIAPAARRRAAGGRAGRSLRSRRPAAARRRGCRPASSTRRHRPSSRHASAASAAAAALSRASGSVCLAAK